MTDKELSDFIEHGSNHFMEFALVFGDGWAGQAIQIAKELRTRQRESRIDKMINQQKKEWVTLTDEEILEEYRQSYGDDGDLTDVYFARVIEFRLKEKNT